MRTKVKGIDLKMTVRQACIVMGSLKRDTKGNKKKADEERMGMRSDKSHLAPISCPFLLFPRPSILYLHPYHVGENYKTTTYPIQISPAPAPTLTQKNLDTQMKMPNRPLTSFSRLISSSPLTIRYPDLLQ